MNRLRVITFHRIGDRESVGSYDPKLLSASPQTFERQISWLARNYEVISADEVLSARCNSMRLPKKALFITFDDAYPDFKTVAWPILQRYDIPVTLFVPTAYPGSPRMPFWWDALHSALLHSRNDSIRVEPFGVLSLASAEDKARASALIRARVKQLPHDAAMDWLGEIRQALAVFEHQLQSTLTWDELRSLAREGVTIGAHSRTHALLTAIPMDRVADEIEGSLADLRREIGDPIPMFCYPAGAYDRSVLEIAEQAGVQIGFTTETGLNNLDTCHPLALRRLNISPRTTLTILKARLTTAGACIDRLRKQWR